MMTQMITILMTLSLPIPIVLGAAGSLDYTDVVLTIIAIITGAAVPWAYVIERRLAVIETESKVNKNHEARLRRLELVAAAASPEQAQAIIAADET